MQTLTHWMYLISMALLLPVIATLLGMAAWTFALLGGFFREIVERRSARKRIESAVSLAKEDGTDREKVWEASEGVRSGLIHRFCKNVGGKHREQSVVEKSFADLENNVTSSLAKLSFLTRLGPMLGLMGTLIPLGPALTGLAGGDIKELSGNLVVAFTATVVGLLVSVVAYSMGLARRTWYAQDMSDLEFLIGRPSAEVSK
jgi:biopolymer transport protein ExbB/TolQ